MQIALWIQCGYKSGIFDTRTLMHRLHAKDGKRLYSVPMTAPVEFVGVNEHKLHPYVMGLLLAEGYFGGSVSVTICEPEIYDRVVKLLPSNYRLKSKKDPDSPCDYYITRDDKTTPAILTKELRRFGLFGKLSYEKFIPQEYLYDSLSNRLELLRGLMDGDGTISKKGHVTYSTSSQLLANDVQWLVQSIGGTCSFSIKESCYTYKGEKKLGRQSIRCNISVIDATQIFTLAYKVERVKARTKYFPKRMIERIDFLRKEEAQCILLDHPAHLYLTDNFIVTHNTLVGKAAYTSLCARFGKKAMSSGWIYVKGPEMLSMYVGIAEQNIREAFHRGRKHFQKTGLPAIMFVDEAESILPMRGSGRSSDIEKTTVPMFLSEMDGLEENHTIVLLATNRPNMIDPAILRPGRIDRHIKIPRPDINTAAEIFKIHLKNIPLADIEMTAVAAMVTAELFSKEWVLYKIIEQVGKGMPVEHIFTLKDAVNGAMVANVVEQAVNLAIRRDLRRSKSKPNGVTLENFQEAVKAVYRGQVDQNHSFDLEDFCDVHRINRESVSVQKLRAALL